MELTNRIVLEANVKLTNKIPLVQKFLLVIIAAVLDGNLNVSAQNLVSRFMFRC